MKAAVRVYAAPWPGHEGGRRLLARALEREGRSWAEPERRPDGGKPFLPGFPFNLSHSGDWSVCAVGPADLGVDLQAERPLRRDLSRRFAPEEREWLQGLPEKGRPGAFFDLWAVKEAVLKATGQGLAGGLNSFRVELGPPLRLTLPGWDARLIPFPAAGYHLALCVQGELEDAELILEA